MLKAIFRDLKAGSTRNEAEKSAPTVAGLIRQNLRGEDEKSSSGYFSLREKKGLPWLSLTKQRKKNSATVFIAPDSIFITVALAARENELNCCQKIKGRYLALKKCLFSQGRRQAFSNQWEISLDFPGFRCIKKSVDILKIHDGQIGVRDEPI